MIILSLLAAITWFGLPSYGLQSSRHADVGLYQPDSGISVDFLVKLGTATETFLIKRLNDAEHSKFHPGLAAELANLGGRENPNIRIAEALNGYAQGVIKRQDFSTSSRVDVCYSLWAIGQRGGTRGIEMLSEWLETNSLPMKRRRFPEVDDFFVDCAIRGIGWSPEPTSQAVLEKFSKSPPRARNSEQIRNAILSAIGLNRRISQEGIKALLYPSDYSDSQPTP